MYPRVSHPAASVAFVPRRSLRVVGGFYGISPRGYAKLAYSPYTPRIRDVWRPHFPKHPAHSLGAFSAKTRNDNGGGGPFAVTRCPVGVQGKNNATSIFLPLTKASFDQSGLLGQQILAEILWELVTLLHFHSGLVVRKYGLCCGR